MSRLLLTGDVHGEIDISKLSNKAWPQQKELTKEDYLIILGDFGLVWNENLINTERYWLQWLEEKPFTTLFIPGNHECYPRLREYPLEFWNDGFIRRIRPSVIMLERGYVFQIGGKTFFCMGGARSTDKASRVEGSTWWPEEMPSKEEYDLAATNLEKYNHNVDYIITHCGPNSIIEDKLKLERDELTTFFENYVNKFVTFKQWFMGHYHFDCSTADHKYNLIYYDILELVNDDFVLVDE